MFYVHLYSDKKGYQFIPLFTGDISELAELFSETIVSLQDKDLGLFDLI